MQRASSLYYSLRAHMLLFAAVAVSSHKAAAITIIQATMHVRIGMHGTMGIHISANTQTTIIAIRETNALNEPHAISDLTGVKQTSGSVKSQN